MIAKLLYNNRTVRRKQDPLTLGSAAIIGGLGLGSSILGGLFGKSSQDSANATNIMLQRETNAQNYKIWQEQVAHQDKWNQYGYDWNSKEAERQRLWQWKMYQRELKDQSPAAQMARYKAAGLNPYFTLGNIQSGNVQANVGTSAAAGMTPSTPAAPVMGAPSVQPYDPLGAFNAGASALQNAVNGYFDNSLKSSQNSNLDFAVYDKVVNRLNRLDKIRKKHNGLSPSQDKQYEELSLQRSAIVKQMAASVRLQSNQGKLVNQQYQTEKINTALAGIREQLDNAELWLKTNTNEFNRQRAEREVRKLQEDIDNVSVDTAVKRLQSVGLRISNEFVRRLKQAETTIAEAEATMEQSGTWLYQGEKNPLKLILPIVLKLLGRKGK